MGVASSHVERRFILVPLGASWVEAAMRTSGFDTTRRFLIHTVQICPLQRLRKWESVASFPSSSAKNFAFAVVGGQTMELAIAQFWLSGIGSDETVSVDFEIVFHGIDTKSGDLILDGSEAPIRIDAEALLAYERLAPAAILNKIRVPYRPIDAKLSTLPSERDKLPSGKQILALTLRYKFKLDDAAAVTPQIPLLNNRVYDSKFESQFYMISDSNKRVCATGDVYPKSTKLPKGEYNIQLQLRHENVQVLEKMKQLVLFIERKLEDKDAIRLSFFSKPDGPVMGYGAFKSSLLIPGKKEAFYLAPPAKDKLPKNCPQGSVLQGLISYGRLSSAGQEEGKNPQKNPAQCRISYIVPPPPKQDKDKDKGSPAAIKTVSERLEEMIRDAKIKFLARLKQGIKEERTEWTKLSNSLKSEYPQYTPLLAKILDGILSRSDNENKVSYNEEVIGAANEVIDSIDRDELAKFFAFKYDPEDEEAEKIKKKMETTRYQLVEALYRKGLALWEIESAKNENKALNSDATEGAEDADSAADQSKPDLPAQPDLFDESFKELKKWVNKALNSGATDGAEDADSAADQSKPDLPAQPDLFDENFKELKKWVNVKSSQHGTLLVIHEKRNGRLGSALKTLNDIIRDDGEPPKKKFYELKLSLLDEIGWTHLAAHERQWMHVRFPPSLPMF